MGNDFSSYFKANSNIPSYRENTGMQSYILRIWQKNNFWIVELHTLPSLLTFLQEKCVFLQANTQKAEKRITGSRFFNLSS